MIIITSVYTKAQKNPATINSKEYKNIQQAIQNVIIDHRDLLATIADPTTTVADVEDIKKNRINSVYLNDAIKVEIDYEADIKGSGKGEQSIADYLSDFHNHFHTKKTEEFVEIKNDWNGKIYQGENNPWAQVNFMQEFNGKDEKGKNFTRVNKVADVQLTKVSNQWTAKISKIYFADKISGANNYKYVTVIDNGVPVENNENLQDENYYKSRLEQGIIALNNKKYAKAYYYLNEAMKSKNEKEYADRKIDELKNQLRREAANETWEQYIYNQMKQEAGILEDKKDYELAKDYYKYAYIAYNQGKDAQIKADDLQQKVNKLKRIEQLYKNSYYEDAISAYKKALNDDGDNSNLYLGLAKCYAKNGEDSMATIFFDKAIEKNQDNIQIYKWQADFLKQNKDYTEAQRSYLNFLNHAEVNDPDISLITSLKTSCKGIELFNSNRRSEAVDSFNKAVQYYDNNSEAYYYLSKYYAEEKKDFLNAKKFADRAIAVDTNYIPAYIQMADLLIKKSYLLNLPATDASANSNKEEAIKLYTKAIEKNRRLNEAYFKRGSLYYELKEKNADYLIDAKEDFTKASEDSLSNNYYRYKAFWYRGKCYYTLGGEMLRKALEDFKKCESNLSNANSFCTDYGFVLLKLKDVDNANQWFKRASLRYPEALYGEILTGIYKDPNILNVEKERLDRAVSAGSIKKERIKQDFSDLGLSNLLKQEPMKGIIKGLN